MNAVAVETLPAERPAYTLTEYANALGRSYPYVFKLWQAGEIDGAFRVGRLVLVPKATVEQAVASRVTAQ